MQRKNTKIWIIFIVAPLVLLISTALLQTVIRFVLNSSGSDGGVVAVLGLLGLPVWVILLVLAVSYNSKITSAVLPTEQDPEQNQQV
jgi:hypothetical protein